MQVTVTFDPTEAEEVVKAVQAIGAAAVGANEPSKAAEDKKPAAKKAADKKPAAKKAEEKPADDDGLGDDDAPSGPSREDVRAKLKEYAALEGKDAAIAILKDNGAASIGELDEDKFQDVIDACET